MPNPVTFKIKILVDGKERVAEATAVSENRPHAMVLWLLTLCVTTRPFHCRQPPFSSPPRLPASDRYCQGK